MKKIIAFITILRPLNFLITFLSIYFAIVIADKSLFLSWKAFLGSLAGGIISGAGMVINDYFDVEIDRINRPERPIPAGLISSNTAIVYYVILNLIALALLLFTNSIALLIALISIVVIFFYSHSLKNRGLIGNFVVGFMTGLAFIFGGVIGENVLPMLFPFLFALLVNFAREILKDVEDIEGDRIKNLKTFPIVYGEKRAIQFFVFLISLTIIVTIIPFLLGVFNVYYLLIVLFLVDLVFVHIIKRVLNQPSRTELRKLSELIKYEMIFGLIAIYIGVN
jgi:geranylgeranylglycerol-phosphate geranylgeranyltransferase